jgi:hypothetical protein
VRLEFIEIIGRVLVENDDVGVQALHSPVLLREQHLPDEGEAVRTPDADHDDGQVAGNAVAPEVGLRQGVAGQRVGTGAGDVRAEHP